MELQNKTYYFLFYFRSQKVRFVLRLHIYLSIEPSRVDNIETTTVKTIDYSIDYRLHIVLTIERNIVKTIDQAIDPNIVDTIDSTIVQTVDYR